MWVVYLIQHSESKEVYFGVTANLKRRLIEHNNKHGGFTNRSSGRWILIYAEAYRDKRDAVVRERKLKHHGSGKHELIKRLPHSKM